MPAAEHVLDYDLSASREASSVGMERILRGETPDLEDFCAVVQSVRVDLEADVTVT